MIFLCMQLLMNTLKGILKHMGVFKSKVASAKIYVASNVITDASHGGQSAINWEASLSSLEELSG